MNNIFYCNEAITLQVSPSDSTYFYGISCLAYLDDMITFASSESQCQGHLTFAQNTLVKLGFFLNHKKSQLFPSQSMEWLGVSWDSQNLSIRLPLEKAEIIASMASNKSRACSIHCFRRYYIFFLAVYSFFLVLGNRDKALYIHKLMIASATHGFVRPMVQFVTPI